MEKILTGSAEWFDPKDCKDKDYITVDENQTEVMKHARENGDCLFSYRKMEKAEYLEWLATKNGWALNNSPLITRKWLEYFGIEPFGNDREALIAIYRKWFDFCYRNTSVERWNKAVWHIYIFVCQQKNGSYDLTTGQLANGLLFKKRTPNESAVKELFDYFA